jgi:hypothetical protein
MGGFRCSCDGERYVFFEAFGRGGVGDDGLFPVFSVFSRREIGYLD